MTESRRVHQNIDNLPLSWNLLHTPSDPTVYLSQEQKPDINSFTAQSTESTQHLSLISQTTHTLEIEAVIPSSACASSQDPGHPHDTNIASRTANLPRVKRKRRPRPSSHSNNANGSTAEFTDELSSQHIGALASAMINLEGGGAASGESEDPFPPPFEAEAMAATEATVGGPPDTDGMASENASASVPLICAVCGERALGCVLFCLCLSFSFVCLGSNTIVHLLFYIMQKRVHWEALISCMHCSVLSTLQ